MVKVIGTGLGRTGTTSLKEALEILGFDPCYHMQEVIPRADYIRQWHAIAHGGKPDWDRVFDGWQATVDHPACLRYAELIGHYPDAKVVHTVREPDRWYESTYATIYGAQTVFPRYMQQLIKPIGLFMAMNDAMIWNGLFEGRFEDRDFAIQKFHEHNEAVQTTVPADRLLVFSVKDGWEPLCDFLGVPVPDVPFPHANPRRVIKYGFGTVRVVTRVLPVVALGVLVWLVIEILRRLL